MLNFEIDSELILNVSLISVVCIGLIFFLYTKLFKMASKFKIFFLAIITYICVILSGIAVMYVVNNEYQFSNTGETRYNITGTIRSISGNEISVHVTDTSTNKISGNIKVKINDVTAIFVQKNSLNSTKVDLDALKASDKIDMICTYNENSGNITALKIVLDN